MKAEIYPLLPVRNTVVFPATTIFLVIGRSESIAALKAAKRQDGKIIVVTQREDTNTLKDIEEGNLYVIGCLCQIRNVIGNDNTGYQVLVTGINKFNVLKIEKKEDYTEATGNLIYDINENTDESTALFNSLKKIAKEVVALTPGSEEALVELIEKIKLPEDIINQAVSYIKVDVNKMQSLLEEQSVIKKMKLLINWFSREKEVLLLEKDIRDKVGVSLSKVQREVLLREQLKAIREELGESEDVINKEYLTKIKEADMPEGVEHIAIEEANKLSTTHASSPDHQVIRNHLDWLLQMPWNKSSDEIKDLKRSKDILEKHHYGLTKVHNRILEHLAVLQLKGNLKGPILCLYGPPGVGKTSLGKSIAETTGRQFIRISLGGVKDESEIRGHRRTYIGSMPGRIIQAIKRAGVNNPLILFDEIDKLGASVQGDPASALLEVLDPEQNFSFVDHYLDVPFDLTQVFFMVTANRLDTIPGPLRDRMEIIELRSYTLNEKVTIAKQFIIKQVFQETGINNEEIIFDEKILETIIQNYTRESGVRELKRIISSLCRGAIYEMVQGSLTTVTINSEKVEKYLGPIKFSDTQRLRNWKYGLAIGLAWTPVGGDILYLECLSMEGTGKLKLTGQLGAVMKESAELALSYTRSFLKNINPEYKFEEYDIHLHVPAGAIPKDGPSAGVTMLTVIVSLITQVKVNQDLAMTGEITLSGNVLPVGGIKEKVIAAHRYNIKKIIIPRQNEKDLIEIPEEIKKDLIFIPVDSVEQVLEAAMNIKLNNIQPFYYRGTHYDF